ESARLGQAQHFSLTRRCLSDQTPLPRAANESNARNGGVWSIRPTHHALTDRDEEFALRSSKARISALHFRLELQPPRSLARQNFDRARTDRDATENCLPR